MPPAAEFCGEDTRVSILAAYGASALQDDPELTRIARFAAQLCETPIAFVTLVEREAQVFIAREGSDLEQTPRSTSFCAHAMLGPDTMIVPDATRDPRFAGNELVTGDHHIRFYAGAPLVSREGAPLGALCIIDTVPRPNGLTDLQRNGLEVLAQAAMRRLTGNREGRAAHAREVESARAMRDVADLLPAIIWSADADGKFVYFNSQWATVTGLDAPRVVADWRAAIHPDDMPQAFAAWEYSFAGGESFESEYRLKQADGSWRWTLERAIAVRDGEGKVHRWYGTLTDVDDSHRTSDNRDILARELSHRIKNIFAVVAGLVSIRARKHEAAREFADELVGAIRSLGRAHDFVRPVEGAKGDSLRGLLTELMAPYADDGDRIVITGEDCEIGPRAATPLALIFHELATNSAKYGALSAESGSITIAMVNPGADDLAHIEWREHGGPPAEDTGETGFGSRLVKMSIEGQLNGRLERRFAPAGLEIDLFIPLSAIRN